jgi:hypothetical protein
MEKVWENGESDGNRSCSENGWISMVLFQGEGRKTKSMLPVSVSKIYLCCCMIELAWSVILIESVILLCAKTIIWQQAHTTRKGQPKATDQDHKTIFTKQLCHYITNNRVCYISY